MKRTSHRPPCSPVEERGRPERSRSSQRRRLVSASRVEVTSRSAAPRRLGRARGGGVLGEDGLILLRQRRGGGRRHQALTLSIRERLQKVGDGDKVGLGVELDDVVVAGALDDIRLPPEGLGRPPVQLDRVRAVDSLVSCAVYLRERRGGGTGARRAGGATRAGARLFGLRRDPRAPSEPEPMLRSSWSPRIALKRRGRGAKRAARQTASSTARPVGAWREAGAPGGLGR